MDTKKIWIAFGVIVTIIITVLVTEGYVILHFIKKFW